MYSAAATREAALAAIAALCNGGTINIYSGTQPTTPDTALGGGNHLLATLTFDATAFTIPGSDASTSSTITARTITGGTAIYTGVATFARALTSGTAVVCDFTVGASGSGADLIINSTSVSSGASVTCSSLTITQNE